MAFQWNAFLGKRQARRAFAHLCLPVDVLSARIRLRTNALDRVLDAQHAVAYAHVCLDVAGVGRVLLDLLGVYGKVLGHRLVTSVAPAGYRLSNRK